MPCRAGLRVDGLRLVATQRGGILLPDAATAKSKGGGLSGGTIAGIVVGVLFGLAALFCELPRIRNANRCVLLPDRPGPRDERSLVGFCTCSFNTPLAANPEK